MERWQDVYHHWRANGSLSSNSHAEPLSHWHWDLDQNVVFRQPHLQHLKAEIKDFYLAWNTVNQLSVNRLLAAVCHRHKRADLFDCYQRALQRLALADNAVGERSETAAKQTLFRVLYPQWRDVENPNRNESTKSAYAKYDRLIKAGKRWSLMRDRLGPGLFALIPESTVSHTFVEHDLKIEQFHIWVTLIQRWNSQAVELGRLIVSKVERALSGLQPSTKRLVLETVQRSKIKALPDMRGLLEEVDEGLLTSGDEADTSNAVVPLPLPAIVNDQPLSSLAAF